MPSKASFYTEAAVTKILDAYRHIFPVVTPALREYWGLDRPVGRNALVTTDFHARPDYEAFRRVHELSTELYNSASPERAADLHTAIKTHGVGCSLGICPWTDSLLLQTYSPAKRNVVLLLGHDTYPMFGGTRGDSPLIHDGLVDVTKYRNRAPESFFQEAGPLVLFANFVPDFRNAGRKKTGAIGKNVLSYQECLQGLHEMLRLLRTQFDSVSVVAWGAKVWEHARLDLDGSPVDRPASHSLKTFQQRSAGRLSIFAGQPYLQLSHPRYDGNIVDEHQFAGFKNLGLGRDMKLLSDNEKAAVIAQCKARMFRDGMLIEGTESQD